MSHVFHRHVRMDPPIAVAGDGPYIVDAEGRRYLDASGGAAVSCLGHGDAEVVQAIKKQVARCLTYLTWKHSRPGIIVRTP